MQLVENAVCLSLHQNPFVVPFFILAGFFYLFQWEQTNTSPGKSEPSKNRQKIQFYLFVFFRASFTIYAPYVA